MRLSAVIIARNEEAVLEACLAPLAGFDEIVVVDTGSTDATVELARRFTDRVFTDFAWCDDFAAARNHAMARATGDWILSVDADHRLLTPVEAVRREAERLEGLGVRTALCKAVYASGQHHWFGVLFKRHRSVKWVGAVHECITPASGHRAEIELLIGESKAKATDPERNLRILLKSGAKTPRERFYLGKEYFERGQNENAIAWMRAYLDNPAWWVETSWAWLTIAYCQDGLGRNEKARDACLESIRHNPDCREALQLMARLSAEPWRSKWNRLAAAATNADVLFVRA